MNGSLSRGGLQMITAAIILFFMSAILLIVTLRDVLAIMKPGVYPPKQVLKKRAFTLGCAGGFFLFVGAIIFYFV
jgi:hypothetical protein